jgi:hypothetical protein
VYENVEKRTTWVLGKNASNRIIRHRIEPDDALELISANTVHLFDAKAGLDSYSITRAEGAFQVVFSSTNINSYKQFMRQPDVYQALLPSLHADEFNRYVELFGVSADDVKNVVNYCGYGRIRPLKNLEVHQLQVNGAINSFNLDYLPMYASASNDVSGSKNPAILLNAFVSRELEDSEDDLKVLHEVFRFDNGLWDFSSPRIWNELKMKFGNDADIFVRKLYYSLRSQRNTTFSPLIGRLFEAIAPQLIIEGGGLDCVSVSEPQELLKVGTILGSMDCAASQTAAEIISNCVDHSKIYSFVKPENNKQHPGFDAFIPPNNLISFTQSTMITTNKPILLSVLLDWSKELALSKVNFITVVPSDEKDKWLVTQQSFKVDVVEEVNWIKGNEMKVFNKSGQRQLTKLSPDTQGKLRNVKQFIGVIPSSRKFSSSTFRVAAKFLSQL